MSSPASHVAVSQFEETGAPRPRRKEQRYRVWAPSAKDIVLALDQERVLMTRDGEGWWTADRQMQHGERYAYVVDGEGPFPDPRSARQPSGVHGWSQCVDHTLFHWSDCRWQAPPLASGIVYELHIGTFTEAGTFEAAIDRLPYLADLGVTHVELMPVCEFSGSRGWGYDGVNLFAPHHEYGSPDDLKRLVDACHGHGLAVLLDVVYNHLGPAGNHLARFGPYFTSRYRTPWGDAVNLDDAGSDEVRRFFCDNAVMWLREYHFDGLRLDAVHALVDTSAQHFLEQLSGEVEALGAVLGRHLVLIAESDLNDPRVTASREAGGYGIGAQWSDDFHHALHAVLTGERSGYYEDFGALRHLARALESPFVYDGRHSLHRQRRHGRISSNTPGGRFIVAAQNHDQIGNRATGERLSHLVSVRRVKIAAALLFTSPFVPLIFQGEEWAASSPFLYFTAHEDEVLANQVSEGRRKEFAAFGWDGATIPDPQSRATFERSRLCWDEVREAPHEEILRWYRALICLRREHPSLRDGNFQDVSSTFDESRGLLLFRRGPLLVTCNLSDRPATVDAGHAVRVLLASPGDVVCRAETVDLPSESVAIFETLDETRRA